MIEWRGFTSPSLTRDLAKEQTGEMDHHREEQRQHEQTGKHEAKKWGKEMEMWRGYAEVIETAISCQKSVTAAA